MPSKNGLKGAVSGQREQGISLVPRDQLNYTKCKFCIIEGSVSDRQIALLRLGLKEFGVLPPLFHKLHKSSVNCAIIYQVLILLIRFL